jgi:dihydropyrimidinase
MYPKKGTLEAGSDADIVIWDPRARHTISAASHHMRVDYSMFEGIEVTGMPDTVFSHGRMIVDRDNFLGRAGSGEFLCRSTYSQP